MFWKKTFGNKNVHHSTACQAADALQAKCMRWSAFIQQLTASHLHSSSTHAFLEDISCHAPPNCSHWVRHDCYSLYKLFATYKGTFQVDYGDLLQAIWDSCQELGLQAVDSFTAKCIQLYETTLVRHGLMLVAPTMGGKTVCYRVLQKVRRKLNTTLVHASRKNLLACIFKDRVLLLLSFHASLHMIRN